MKSTITQITQRITRRLPGWSLLASACLFGLTAKASVLWDGDASNGTGVFGSLNIENQSGQVNVVTDSTYGKVFQFICYNPTTAIKTRTEASHMAGFDPLAGNTYYFGWRHKWGPLPVECGKWQALEQIHVQGGNSSGAPVPYQLLSDGCDNNLHFTYQDASATPHVFLMKPIPLNSWHTLVYHEKWSESESDGYVEVWWDGTMQTLANGSTRYPAAWCYPTTTSYWKWGIYRSGTGTTALGTEYAYLGQAKAGTTYADVNPGGSSQVTAPTFSPGGGTYSAAQSVTISTTTGGASIRYTTDGSTPSETSGTVYSGPVTISTTTTLNAIAYESGMTDSSVTSAAYTISIPTPDFSVSATPSSQTVTAGNQTTYTVNLGNINAFTGTISLSASGLPAGATANFNPASLTAPASSTLTVSTGTSTPAGTSTLTITGNSGSLSHNTTVSLTVTSSSGAMMFEAESLAVANSGVGTSLQTDANSSGGTWVQLNATGTGNWMEFTTPSINAGTYSVSMKWKGNTSRGQLNFKVDGTQLGGTLDQYSSTQTYPTTTFGTVTFSTAGTHKLRLTVTGKNSASSNYYLSADNFTFTPSNPPPAQVAAPAFSPAGGTYSSAQSVTISTTTGGASIRYTTDGSTPSETSGTAYSGPVTVGATTTLKAIAYESGMTDSTVSSATYTISSGGATVSFEAENLAVTNSGVGTSVQTDANSSGGKWIQLNATGTGSWMEFTTGTVNAGTYSVSMMWKGNTSRGITDFFVDGVQLGGTLDQYSSSQTYPTTAFGTVTFSTAGTHKIRMHVTGKNSASSNYYLSADKFTFTSQ